MTATCFKCHFKDRDGWYTCVYTHVEWAAPDKELYSATQHQKFRSSLTCRVSSASLLFSPSAQLHVQVGSILKAGHKLESHEKQDRCGGSRVFWVATLERVKRLFLCSLSASFFLSSQCGSWGRTLERTSAWKVRRGWGRAAGKGRIV